MPHTLTPELIVPFHDGTQLAAPCAPYPCTYLRRTDAAGQTLGMAESLQMASSPAAALRALMAAGSTAYQQVERYLRTPSGRTLDVLVAGDAATVRIGTIEGDELAMISQDEMSQDPVTQMARIASLLSFAG